MTSLAQILPAAAFAEGSLARRVAAVLAGSTLLAAMAQISVPMFPVPMTMQMLAVLLIGAFGGWRLAAETLLAYIVEAELGLPVLAGGASGFVTLLGPRGGYVIGFLLSAVAVGYFAERGWHRTLAGLAASMLIGAALVYLPGIAWLATFPKVGGLQNALAVGMVPFLIGDAVKAALAGAIVLAANRVMFRA
jgi:biotin transport system substrate-specific component